MPKLKAFFDSLGARKPSPEEDVKDAIVMIQMYVGLLRDGECGYRIVADGLDGAVKLLERSRTE